MMDFDQIRQYWQERAKSDSSAQSTTQDYYLREIESRVLKDLIDKICPKRVADIGCGDGRTTLRLATEFPSVSFSGWDYSDAMIRNAEKTVSDAGVKNIAFGICDVTKPLNVGEVDLFYTTRCLINLPSWELQKLAIHHIWMSLPEHGHYIMIENFIEGHEAFNRIREAYGLRRIPIRSHNLLFDRAKLEGAISSKFEVIEEVNISSTYYLVSRIVYSKICQDSGVEPDYFNDHHRYATGLPFLGEFGPARMLCLRKK